MTEKNKKTPEQIRLEIVSQLNKGPKSIAELSENIGSNWLTIEKFLNELREDEKVSELISSQKSKIYCSSKDLAFYFLPFSENIRNDTLSLLHQISKTWKEKNGEIPSRTILQKIAVMLVEEEKINLPVLRFHYGKTLALRYEEQIEEENDTFVFTKEQYNSLLQLIKRYKNWSSHKMQLEQYQKSGMEFYQEKEKNIVPNFISKAYEELEISFLKLSAFYPVELQLNFKQFDKFIYCAINLLNLKNSKKEEYFGELKELFYLIWDCLTTEAFFCDAERYITEEKKELFSQIKSNVLNSKLANVSSRVDDLESEVNSINSNEIDNPVSERTKEFLHELIEE